MKRSLREAQQRGTVRVGIFWFIIRNVYGLFLDSITANDEEIKDIIYPVNFFMLLHETKKVYLSFANKFTHSLLIPFYERLIKTIIYSCFSRVNRTVTKNIYPMELKLGR